MITQPTGAGTFYLFYRNAIGKSRKQRIGEFVPESEAARHKGQDGSKPLTLSEARLRAEKLRHVVRDGGDPVAEAEARANAITFKALAERFLIENPDLAASTRTVYRYCLDKDAFPVIGGLPACDVTADHVVAICKRIEKTGARVQSERTKTTIGGVFRWGMKQHLAKANPCKDIGRRSPTVARTRTPSDAELAALWNAIEARQGKLSQAVRLIMQLAILTAQRRTEVAGARLSELQGLDTSNPVWVIPGDVNKRGKIIEGRTKNGREQKVPLSSEAAALFRKAIELSDSSEFVFPADLKRVKIAKAPRVPHIHGESVTMAMRRLRNEIGLEDISIHDMRRAVSNWLKDQGVSREVRDLVLNHKDPSVTEAHYSSAARMEPQVRHALQSWADHVMSVVRGDAIDGNVVRISARRARTA